MSEINLTKEDAKGADKIFWQDSSENIQGFLEAEVKLLKAEIKTLKVREEKWKACVEILKRVTRRTPAELREAEEFAQHISKELKEA